ncbi:hypothetical protein OG365_40515 (plasmid) [Streptomyces sp. NBC_00853]|uniref:hypothetical protein n=1 Tax=Streptomyces sp. NBC_00853 TaxID=2903681 RepID=UPI00387360A2|nr:hypothetical protein OG365_40515 [Streptomyces sp. NBC_00853]
MSQTHEISGVDLARVALRAAREAAKKNGARTPKSKPRLARTVRARLTVSRGGRHSQGGVPTSSCMVGGEASIPTSLIMFVGWGTGLVQRS